jgi:hypothetical protein
MRIEILSEAEDDLVAGAKFYERRRAGLADYFLNSLYSDIDSLLLYAGIHRLIVGFHWVSVEAISFCDFLSFWPRQGADSGLRRVGFAPRSPLDQGTAPVDLERKSTIIAAGMSNNRYRSS